MELKLQQIFNEEKKSLEALLRLLDEQYIYIMTRDVFNMESIVEKIKYANKHVAEIEVERRKIIGSNSMKDYIKNCNNQGIKDSYREIVNLIKQLEIQNDTNKSFIRQDLAFANKILGYINPNRDTITYNSYGKTIR